MRDLQGSLVPVCFHEAKSVYIYIILRYVTKPELLETIPSTTCCKQTFWHMCLLRIINLGWNKWVTNWKSLTGSKRKPFVDRVAIHTFAKCKAWILTHEQVGGQGMLSVLKSPSILRSRFSGRIGILPWLTQLETPVTHINTASVLQVMFLFILLIHFLWHF